MNITRRSAIIGAIPAVIVAGLPAATTAAARGNPDAKLFALVDDLERADREHAEAALAWATERRAIQDRIPVPPRIIRVGSGQGGDHIFVRPTIPAKLFDKSVAAKIRETPEASERIAAGFERLLAESHAHEVAVDRIVNSPKARALLARSNLTRVRCEGLADEINATPAGTVAGVLRKLQASAVTTPMIASAMRDLECLAGEVRS